MFDFRYSQQRNVSNFSWITNAEKHCWSSLLSAQA